MKVFKKLLLLSIHFLLPIFFTLSFINLVQYKVVSAADVTGTCGSNNCDAGNICHCPTSCPGPTVDTSGPYSCGGINSNGNPNLDSNITIVNPGKYPNLESILNAVFSDLRLVIILVFAGIILYGGFLRMTAQGNEQQVEKSTKTIVAGITGFAIIVFSQPLIELIGKLLGVQGGIFKNVGNGGS